MSEKSSFFDSINGDRAYFASDYAKHMARYFTNGIFDNGLKVTTNNGMNVILLPGYANVNGYDYSNDSNKIIAITNADGVLNRVDNIVIRLDLPNRKVTAEVITGNFAENAIAPDVQRGASIYEIRIAKINVPAGTTEITEDLITDTRFDNNDCGNVICAVQNPNFSGILAQYKALWQNLINEQTIDFEEWFNGIKAQLSGDVAGNLLNQISNKVDKVTGKDLSTNDYSNEEKQKVANLETNKANKKKVWNITLDTTWTGTTAPYTKTVAVEGITADDDPDIHIKYSDNIETRAKEREAYSALSISTTANGSITFQCDENKPEVAMNLVLEVVY